MWLISLALLATFVALLYIYFIWNFNYWKKRGVPGPKPIPVVGAFVGAFMQSTNLVYEIDELYKKYKNTSPFVGYFSSRSPALLALDIPTVKTVLISNFKNFHDTEFSSMSDKENDPIFSRNPFLLTGEEWKEKRGEITPAFTNIKIKSMFPIISDVSHKMNAFLRRRLAEKKMDGFDAKDLAANYTTDVVSSAIYGVDSKAFSDNEKSVIREMGSKLFDFDFKFILYFLVIQMFPFVSKIYTMSLVPKSIEHFFTQLMDDAIKLRKSSGIERDDYLGYLLQLQKKKNLQHIDMAAHTLTFFLDGYETSSLVIAHILYRLAKHPAVQERLRTEIEESLRLNGDQVTYESIGEMKYLDQVFHETLRLNPALGVMSRRCTEPIELDGLKDKKLSIEKSLVVTIPVWSIHHDAEYYPNPEEFNPDRFSEENGGPKAFKDKGVFLAWGDGPRICLGMRFATLQVKAAIIELTKNFHITMNKKTQDPYVLDAKNFLLCPKGGIWVDFKVRA